MKSLRKHKKAVESKLISERSHQVKKRHQRAKLRKLLLKIYKSCVISGWNDPLEIQMAHIIPKKIGYNIKYIDTDTENNCILFSSGLHSLFDNFKWTFDIFSFLDFHVDSETHFQTTLLIHKPPKPGLSSLSGCVGKVYNIPIIYYPSLYAHYYTYLRTRYTTNKDPLTCFKECTESRLFKSLKNQKTTSGMKKYLMGLRESKRRDSGYIIAHKSSIPTYKILWHLWSSSHCTWEPRENITDAMYLQYEDYIDHKSDPDWTPYRTIR